MRATKSLPVGGLQWFGKTTLLRSVVVAPSARGTGLGQRIIRALEGAAREGNAGQLLNQFMGVAIAWVIAIVGTLLILKVVDLTIGLRVSEEEEVQGLDLSQHGEEGYYWETPA